VVAGHLDGEPQRGRERRLEAARRRRTQPRGGQAELGAEGQLAIEPLGLVAVAGDHQRAALEDRHRVARGLAQLVHERRVAARRGDVQRGQVVLAEGGLAGRREHAGGDARGTGTRLAALEHDGPKAALRGPPGDGQADHAASHYRDVEAVRLRVRHDSLPAPALPGSGSDGRRLRRPPSQPRVGSRSSLW
jgi:hypothetical protein